MSEAPPELVDVVVLGGGLAGLCLTRLLLREVPGCSVVSLDRGKPGRRKVGESTVEIGAHFLNVRLGLGELLARSQLPKNGLRFWFDSPEHDLSFQEASEDGPATFAYWRTYQLERETLERDLVGLNEVGGAEHLFEARAIEVEQTEGAARHRIRFERDGQARELHARWLVDASGIRSLQGRATGNLKREPRLTHSACWAWYDGVKRIDALLEEGKGPARFNWGPRALSTNHLLSEGYWVWMIPLASGLYSLGLGYDEEVVTDPPRTQAALDAFLRRHRMLADLLEHARPVEFGQLRRFSFRPERSLSPDRVAWVGTAAGFVDPFFSNGIDLIAIGCELTADLIGRDLASGTLDAARLAAHNTTLDLVYEHFLTSVRGLYPTFASQELSLIRYRRDVHVYWAIYTWPYFGGKLTDPDFLPEYHRLSAESTERGRFFAALLLHAHASLTERGLLHRENAGQFTFNQLGFRNTPYVRFEQQMGHPPQVDRLRTVLHEIDTGCLLAVMDALFDADRSPLKRLLFEAVHPRFEAILAAWRDDGQAFSPAFWERVFALIDEGITASLAAEGLAVEPLALDPTGFRRLLKLLLERCEPEQALAVRKHFNAPPRLHDFADLAPSRDATQPPITWSSEHTPWLDAPPAFTSVYDLLGETWWENPKAPYSALVRWGVRPLLEPKQE